MKLLMISTDTTILDPRSASSERMRGYGQVVGSLVVFVAGTHGGIGRVGRLVRSYSAILRAAAQSRPDVVTSQDPFWTGLIAWRAARISGAGLHLQLHGDFFGSPYWSRTFGGRLKLALGRFLLRRADAVRVVSERVRQSLVGLVPPERITVAPIPFEVHAPLLASPRRGEEVHAPHRATPRRGEEVHQAILPLIKGEREGVCGQYVLCVARLEPEKGVDVLLRAFAALRDTSSRLVIVGDGSERARLERLVAELGVAARTTFWGAQTDLGRFYREATTCVIPSRTESWGRVALEAMDAGCPVVMTDVGLAGEVIGGGESGLVVPPNDSRALTQAIDQVLDDPHLREHLIRGGREALARLDLPAVATQKIVASWQRAVRARPIIMITQLADPDDQNLGFVTEWIAELQKHAPVTALEFRKVGPIGLIGRIMREVRGSRGVFAHMCPEYAILAAPIAHFFGKPVLLWYTHKSVTWRLRLAALLVDKIFTASKESCRIRSQKIQVVGHGIHIKYQISNIKFDGIRPLKLLAVGRMSPVKDFETPIRALAKLRDLGAPAELTIVGGPYLASDKAYEKNLRGLAVALGVTLILHSMGVRRHDEIAAIYHAHDVLMHTSRTGSADKVVLEALAAGLPVVSSSEAFADLLPREARFAPGAVDELAKILHTREVLSLDWQPIFDRVRHENNLERLAARIANFFGV